MAVAAFVQREDVFRDGAPRRAEPLEYSARAASVEVVVVKTWDSHHISPQ